MKKKFSCLETVFKTNFSDGKSYHTHLFLDTSKIELKIYHKSERDLAYNFMVSCNIKQPEYLSELLDISVSCKEIDLKGINCNHSKIKSISSDETDDLGNTFFTVIIDQITIYKEPIIKNGSDTAKIFLNDDGFDLVKNYYSILTSFRQDGQFDIKRMSGMAEYYKIRKSKFRPEYEFEYSDKRDMKSPKIEKIPIIKFILEEDLSESDIINFIQISCKITSFYLGNNIDYFKAFISLKKCRIIIYKTLDNKFKLNISSINHLLRIGGIHSFLKLNWNKNYLNNQNLLDKAITNYTHSRLLDSNSKFLLLYNIIEICMTGSTHTGEEFKLTVSQSKKNTLYNQAFEILKETVNETDIEDFEKKWDTVKKQMIYKPMKSPLNCFLIANNIPVDELEISVGKMKKIRDKIVHGSVSSLSYEEVANANAQLFNLGAVLILNVLGIKNWEMK